jgi:hypothetical protein
MKNELMQMPVNDMMTMAKLFAESGMFQDTRQAAQAFVKIKAGQELGIAPFAAMSGIHIISGKPTIGAGLMGSQVKGSGKYDYKVAKHDDKICSIDFYQGKDLLGNSTFTIEDAKKAGTKNLDKFPKNMLFARALSNGVKWFTPDIFTGPVYVPEEMGNITTEDAQQQADGSYATPAIVATIETPQIKTLPALSDKQYIQALGKIATGEKGVLDKLEALFIISPDQRRGLEEKTQLMAQPEPLQVTEQ